MASTAVRRSRLSPALAATIVAGIVAPIVAGCATLPSGNAPRQVPTGGNAVQAYVRPLPPPPPSSGLYKTPIETVLGFLAASATHAYDPGASTQFLSPALRKTWRPKPVIVVTSLKPKKLNVPPQGGTCRGRQRTCAGSPVEYDTVQFTAQHLATLSQRGQYQYSAGTSTYSFNLAKKKNGEWLITGLPQGGMSSLLLTKASFQEVYQPRNLFFFAGASPATRELVPDPVYAPLQSGDSALNTDVVAGLVHGLLSDHVGWLSRATYTAFPPKTRLLNVTLRGQEAVVDLGGHAARATGPQRAAMYLQLWETLTSNAYSSPLAAGVGLEINGRPVYHQQQHRSQDFVPAVGTGPLVYQSQADTISEQSGPLPLPGLDQIGSAPVTALAATESSGGGSGSAQSTASGQPVPAVAVAAESQGGGCTVYLPAGGASGGPDRSRRIPGSGGPCTSLSWDRNGNLWAVAGGHIWLLGPQTHHQWLAVSSPANLPPDGKSGPSILSMQLAPDGIRAALLVKGPGGNNRVMLTAVVINSARGKASVSFGAVVPAWTGLSRPTALSWYNPYDLVVLTDTGIWQVPLTGGAGRKLGTTPAGAMSLASNDSTLAVGTAQDGHYGIEVSSNGGNSWKSAPPGLSAPYPTYLTFATYQG